MSELTKHTIEFGLSEKEEKEIKYWLENLDQYFISEEIKEFDEERKLNLLLSAIFFDGLVKWEKENV